MRKCSSREGTHTHYRGEERVFERIVQRVCALHQCYKRVETARLLLWRPLQFSELLLGASDIGFPATPEREQLLLSLQIP